MGTRVKTKDRDERDLLLSWEASVKRILSNERKAASCGRSALRFAQPFAYLPFTHSPMRSSTLLRQP